MMIKMNSDASQLIQILEKTISPDIVELEVAQKFLEQAAISNLPEFLKTLSDILRHGGNSPVARMAASLQLKNNLTSKDPDITAQYQQRWLAFPEDTRMHIKKNIIGALGTENTRPSSAAQCVAYVAFAEIPVGQWPDLISVLSNNVLDPNSTEMMKEATLEAIGYICQDIEQELLAGQSNTILTAIVHGMKQNDPHVKLAATTALYNSLEFTKANFESEAERNYIMEVVCEATQSRDNQVRVAALQCLVRIMTLYYQYMEPYMAQALFPITLEAMKSDINEVALQGIEFWSNISDEEVDLAIEESEAADMGRPPARTSRFYAKGALQYLVPVVLSKLTKQEEIDDEDDWNPSKAASVCLMLLASCCEDDIVQYVLPFVQQNIKNENWRYRDAALIAFGSILGGLESTALKPLVEQAMPTLIELMYDTSVVVRDTAAWTIGRICELVPEVAISEPYLKPLLESLLNGLKSEPRVASNVCWAFTGLAEASYDAAESQLANGDAQPETYRLSPYFEFIVLKLLETTDRADGGQANLRPAAYEALMEMIKNSPKDCYTTVQQATIIILERINQVLAMEQQIQGHIDRAQFSDLKSLLCATLQSVLRKMSPEDAPQISDSIMNALLQMFDSNSCKSGSVQEDALMAISTLVEVLGEGFVKYMPAFKPYLCMALKNHAEYQVCCAAVGLTGDICRAIKLKMIPYCDEIILLLFDNLSNHSVNRDVKPHILSTFGDIAFSIGPEFKKYLEMVLQTLIQASQIQVNKDDYDMMEWLNHVREGIMEAYSNIIHGLKGDGPDPSPDIALLENHLPYIVSFLFTISADLDKSDNNLLSALGLLGDLCNVYGTAAVTLLDVDPINELLTHGRRSRTNKIKSMALWASKELKKHKASMNATS